MRSKTIRLLSVHFALMVAWTGAPALAQTNLGSAFTYQGQLKNSGVPVNGTIHLRFSLWDDPAAGTQIGGTVISSPVAATDGLFTVELDFGESAFNGDARWLLIEVCTDGTCASTTPLDPRQKLAPAPHALALPGLYTQQNATSPNIIGGHNGNLTETSTPGPVVGATIAGGGSVGIGVNKVTDNYGTVGGGANNRAGGNNSSATNELYATVAGGRSNVAQGDYSAVGGGQNQSATGDYSTIAGGEGNVASGARSTVPGGQLNTASGSFSLAAGRRAKANHDGAVVIADSTDADFASTDANQFLIRAGGGVGIGTTNPLAGTALDVAGMIRSSTGGYKFPDGTAQLTASTCSEPRTPISSLPYTITQAGSYYLTGNLAGVSGQNGINVNTSNVTIDLCGFALTGVTESLNGINAPFVSHDMVVRNGTISNWDLCGIDASGCVNSQITNVHSSYNGTDGIRVSQFCEVLRCVANKNGTNGIATSTASLISECMSNDNGVNASGSGIAASFYSIVVNCIATRNGNGSGGGNGISTGGSAVVVNCTASLNGNAASMVDDGIKVDSGSTVMGCVLYSNKGDGVEGSSGCLIADNNCRSNGNSGDAAGVHGTGSDNIIEDNIVTSNDRGIDVDGVGNLIIRNSARNNTTNYELVANNKVGVIVAAPNSGAISGSTGGAGVGTTDPWANISY